MEARKKGRPANGRPSGMIIFGFGESEQAIANGSLSWFSEKSWQVIFVFQNTMQSWIDLIEQENPDPGQLLRTVAHGSVFQKMIADIIFVQFNPELIAQIQEPLADLIR